MQKVRWRLLLCKRVYSLQVLAGKQQTSLQVGWEWLCGEFGAVPLPVAG